MNDAGVLILFGVVEAVGAVLFFFMIRSFKKK